MKPEKGVYRHFKGNNYRVLGTAQHAKSLEEMVVYKAMYGDKQLWVRPLHEFFEAVEHEGVKQPRFCKIG